MRPTGRNSSENTSFLEICLLLVDAAKTTEDQYFYNSQSKVWDTPSLLDR